MVKPGKVPKILNYIFDKTSDFIKEKIFRFDFYGNKINSTLLTKENKLKNDLDIINENEDY